MSTAKSMSIDKKWYFYLASFTCIALTLLGGLTYPPTPWGILAPILYVSVVILCALGILRLIYLKGIPD